MEEIQRQLSQRYEGAKQRKVSGFDIILKSIEKKKLSEQTTLYGNLPGLMCISLEYMLYEKTLCACDYFLC